MHDRQKEILKAIITEFIQTAQPIGSKTILISYNFDVSSATIRNEMANLEKEGLITQPHTSAGRIPTDLGYRVFVNDLINYEETKKEAQTALDEIRKQYRHNQAKRKVQEAVHILSQATTNVSFATLPESRTFYLGLSNVLKKPEFIQNPMQASQVVEILEDNDNFLNTLEQINIGEEIEMLIGQENLVEQIKSCSMIVGRYNLQGFKGYIGLLGPTRMNYPFNTIVLEEIINLLNTDKS